MNKAQISRREVLAGAGVALAGSALAWRQIGAAPTAESPVAPAASIVLRNRRYRLPEAAIVEFAGEGARVVVLQDDPVRQWRGEQAPLLAARGTRLLGVTNWPEFLLVRGLAEESGRRVRHQRLDVASGAITWLIA